MLPSGCSVATVARRRLRIRVSGTVQGVGFRPFVYRLASELGLDGWVLNDTRGVLLEVEGEPAAVERLLARVEGEAPPLAAVEGVECEDLAPVGERGFRDPPQRGRRRGRGAGLARLGDLP